MASITLIPGSFPNGSFIPVNFKSNAGCGEANYSPAFTWSIAGLTTDQIEYFNLYVINPTVAGSSPGGFFMHWGVTNITVAQQNIFQNGSWSNIDVNILNTDYPSGDQVNGWNGPCAVDTTEYQCYVEAKIKSGDAATVFGLNPPDDLLLRSAFITFQDSPSNISNPDLSLPCGTITCPEGSTYIDTVCQTILEEDPIESPTIYTVTAVAPSASNGWFGTRFYRNVNQYTFPLRGGYTASYATSAILEDNNGAGPELPYEYVQGVSSWSWGVETNGGRLNNVGVWTELGGDPVGEWIGFTRCINIETAGVYCIGMGADNNMRVKLNGELIVHWDTGTADNCVFNAWHVIEINLSAGQNILEVAGRNLGVDAVFGYEIYDADVDELIAVTTRIDLENSGYIIYSSRDETGAPLTPLGVFDIGENSGFICPADYTYDSCDTGKCLQINKEEAVQAQCSWIIENCNDATETYTVSFSDADLSLFINSVYKFGPILELINKCFVVRGSIIDTDDYSDLIVLQDYGTNGCATCAGVFKFTNCDGVTVNVSLPNNPATLTIDYLYTFTNSLSGCYQYKGQVTEAPTYDLEIAQEITSDNCLVCNNIHVFSDCTTDEIVHIVLASAETEDYTSWSADQIFELSGAASVENICWQYVETITATSIDPSVIIEDITVQRKYNCSNCESCFRKYKLTCCSDPSEVRYIYWAKDAPLLDETYTYMFDYTSDSDELKCYSVQLLSEDCNEINL